MTWWHRCVQRWNFTCTVPVQSLSLNRRPAQPTRNARSSKTPGAIQRSRTPGHGCICHVGKSRTPRWQLRMCAPRIRWQICPMPESAPRPESGWQLRNLGRAWQLRSRSRSMACTVAFQAAWAGALRKRTRYRFRISGRRQSLQGHLPPRL
jgi:hypothetical protein